MQTRKESAILKNEHKRLIAENLVLKMAEEERIKNKKELEAASLKLFDAMKEQDVLNGTISEQYEEISSYKDEMEKLRLEVTVIMAEKTMQKKELNRVNGLYTKLGRNNKELIDNLNMNIDEVSKLNK